MNFILATLLTYFLGLALSFILPWWIVCAVAFLVAIFMYRKNSHAFLSGALGTMLIWLSLMLFYGNKDNFSFATKVSMIFSDNLNISLNTTLLILFSLAIISLLGGLSALGGKLIMSEKQPNKLSVGKRRIKNEGYTLKLD